METANEQEQGTGVTGRMGVDVKTVVDILVPVWAGDPAAAYLDSLAKKNHGEFRLKGHASHRHFKNGTLGGALFSCGAIQLVRRTQTCNVYRVTEFGREVALEFRRRASAR